MLLSACSLRNKYEAKKNLKKDKKMKDKCFILRVLEKRKLTKKKKKKKNSINRTEFIKNLTSNITKGLRITNPDEYGLLGIIKDEVRELLKSADKNGIGIPKGITRRAEILLKK